MLQSFGTAELDKYCLSFLIIIFWQTIIFDILFLKFQIYGCKKNI